MKRQISQFLEVFSPFLEVLSRPYFTSSVRCKGRLSSRSGFIFGVRLKKATKRPINNDWLICFLGSGCNDRNWHSTSSITYDWAATSRVWSPSFQIPAVTLCDPPPPQGLWSAYARCRGEVRIALSSRIERHLPQTHTPPFKDHFSSTKVV